MHLLSHQWSFRRIMFVCPTFTKAKIYSLSSGGIGLVLGIIKFSSGHSERVLLVELKGLSFLSLGWEDGHPDDPSGRAESSSPRAWRPSPSLAPEENFHLSRALTHLWMFVPSFGGFFRTDFGGRHGPKILEVPALVLIQTETGMLVLQVGCGDGFQTLLPLGCLAHRGQSWQRAIPRPAPLLMHQETWVNPLRPPCLVI